MSRILREKETLFMNRVINSMPENIKKRMLLHEHNWSTGSTWPTICMEELKLVMQEADTSKGRDFLNSMEFYFKISIILMPDVLSLLLDDYFYNLRKIHTDFFDTIRLCSFSLRQYTVAWIIVKKLQHFFLKASCTISCFGVV